MKEKRKTSIRAKLTMWFIAVSLIPLLFVSIIIYSQRVKQIRESAFEKLEAIRDLKEYSLNIWYNHLNSDLHNLSTINSLKKLCDNTTLHFTEDNTSELIFERFNSFKKEFPNYSNLYVIDAKTSEVIVSTNINSIGTKVDKFPEYNAIMNASGNYNSNIYFSALENKNVMTFSFPLICKGDVDEHLIGYLIGNIDPHIELYPLLLSREGLGETGETLIVNQNVIALNELRWYEDAPLKLQITAKPAVLAAAGSTGTILSRDYRNERILAAYTYLPEQKWGFVCKQDLGEVKESVTDMLYQMILIFIGIAGAAILGSVWLGRSYSGSIIAMDKVIASIRKGKYSDRVHLKTTDEFSTLGQAINDLARSTEERAFLRNNLAKIAETILDQTTIQDFAKSVVDQFTAICDAQVANFMILDENNESFETIYTIGKGKENFDKVSVAHPKKAFITVINEKKAKNVTQIPKQCMYQINEPTNKFFPKRLYLIPIISESNVVAIIGLAKSKVFPSRVIRVLQVSESLLNSGYTSLMARERSRIFSEQLYRINQQLEERAEEIRKRAEEIDRQRLVLEDTTKKLQNKNEELEIQKKVIERANKDLESFSYSVSHDLRAPLRAIQGFSDILIEEYSDKLDSEGIRIAKVIHANTEKMNALIKDLLELSRVGRKARNVTDVNMKEMANSMYHEVIDKKTMKKIDIRIGNIPNIKGDTNLLRSVWGNLIGNAVKFSSTRDKIKINISSEKKDGMIIYSVKDNGVGFDKEYQDKLFGVFQRLHTDEEFEGTGVGLAIVKQIVNKHNGEIWAKSTLDKGSTFYFSLPLE